MQNYQINKKRINHHPKRGLAERVVLTSMALSAAAVVTSLFVYFRPFTTTDVWIAAKNLYSYVDEQITDIQERRRERLKKKEEQLAAAKRAELMEKQEELSPPSETVPYIDRSANMGEADSINAEPVFIPQEDAVFIFMLDTALGPMLYYSQGDNRWKDYLYGGLDPMSSYGCGPVCVAMIINSFSSSRVTPIDMADWSAANGNYARHSGSYHSLIPDSLTAFGLNVESVADRSVENAENLLRTGHILVALMGKGSLTDNGHFIIIANLNDRGNVYIADPANYENCTKEWDLQLLMDELKGSYDSGAPLWAVSVPETDAAEPE